MTIKTSKEKTFSAMNSAYLNTANMTINEGYLNDTLQIYLLNNRDLNELMFNNRLKPHSVAWNVLMYEANIRLKDEEFPAQYQANSDQVKKWLTEYGKGYDTIKETINFIIEERKREKENK